jgi:hypothetical protein
MALQNIRTAAKDKVEDGQAQGRLENHGMLRSLFETARRQK